MSALVDVQERAFEGRRVTLRTRAPFEEVAARFVAAFPLIDRDALDRFVAAGDAAGLRSFLERAAPGIAFNTFLWLDQGGAMSLLGAPLKSRFYLVGNALIAQGMFALEPAAGLSAPVRIVVSEAADGTTCIDYDEPSSSFGTFPRLRDSPVPPMLDAKFREALRAIAGA